MSFVDNYTVFCASVQTVQLSGQKSLTAVKTKKESDSHADVCVVGDHCLVEHDHNRTVNVFGYDPKAGSKHACIVNATVAYTQPETGKVVIFLISQEIEMKSLNHHLCCQMQCCINGNLIDEVLKILEAIPSEIIHAMQIANSFYAPNQIINPFQLNGVNTLQA